MKTAILDRAIRLITKDCSLGGAVLTPRARALLVAVSADDEPTARLIMSLEYPHPPLKEL